MVSILLSNDDGVHATGIRILQAALEKVGTVRVFAPDRNRSGASHSLTLSMPLRTQELEPNRISVQGTPTDCVHLALTGLLTELPDMVISGINAGSNMGDDVFYSGTVAAAVEGRHLGLPSIAVSLTGEPPYEEIHYQAAARVVTQLMGRIQSHPLPADTILNINVPPLPYEEIKGIQVTRLGSRHQAQPVITRQDPRGETIYWIGPAGIEQDSSDGTDFAAVRAGFVSVTPLRVDLTRESQISDLKDWAGSVSMVD